MNQITTERRHDVDWLRVIAIFLLIVYHSLIGFQDFGWHIGWIMSNTRLNYLWPIAEAWNVWRIPILFVISGMGLAFAARRRDLPTLIADRSLRIGLPAGVGFLLIGPLTVLPMVISRQREWLYVPNIAHLWFLLNILLYAVLLAPLARQMVESPDATFPKTIRKIMRPAISVWMLALLFAVESALVQPVNFIGYANTFHGLLLGFAGYLFGMLVVSGGSQVWDHFRVMWIPSIVIAFVLYLIRVIFRDLDLPIFVTNLAVGVESAMWITGIFGIAGKLLNRPSKTLTYLSRAVYPVYIFHLPIENALSLVIFKLKVSGEVQLLLLIVGTVGLSFGVYELVKRVEFLRPLFGMKSKRLTGSLS